MQPDALRFFQTALSTPSPSGYEEPIQAVIRDYITPHADAVRTDVHGNLIATIGDTEGPGLMYAGHCDQIGMVISYIDELGFLYAQTIGGWDPQQLVGQAMTIWTANGPIDAVISRKPIHLLTTMERGQVVQFEQMWLDIGVATVQEEIGLRGATTAAGSIKPSVAIAVDVTHASDCPTIDKNKQGDIKLGKGPVIFRGPNINAKLAARLIELCESNSIPYQLAALGRAAPNDSNVLQIHGGGVATGLVSIPNRYMHSAVETISLDDIDCVAQLLTLFAQSLTNDCDFIPG